MQPPRPDRADAAKLSRRRWPACRHDGHEADVLALRELRPQVIDAPAPLLAWGLALLFRRAFLATPALEPARLPRARPAASRRWYQRVCSARATAATSRP